MGQKGRGSLCTHPSQGSRLRQRRAWRELGVSRQRVQRRRTWGRSHAQESSFAHGTEAAGRDGARFQAAAAPSAARRCALWRGRRLRAKGGGGEGSNGAGQPAVPRRSWRWRVSRPFKGAAAVAGALPPLAQTDCAVCASVTLPSQSQIQRSRRPAASQQSSRAVPGVAHSAHTAPPEPADQSKCPATAVTTMAGRRCCSRLYLWVTAAWAKLPS